MTWEQLRDALLALPSSSELDSPLLGRIRDVTGTIFWEDLDSDLDPQTLAVIYLFKKVADDVFFNFGQDSFLPLDSLLEDGKLVQDHVDEVLSPLVEFVQSSLRGQPWEETAELLPRLTTQYLKLVRRISARGRVAA